MRVSIGLHAPLRDIPPLVTRAEALGFDMFVANETSYEPMLMLGAAALASERAVLTTGVALAFPRSPYVMAQAAWEIQRASNGRLLLGLGSQVKGHMERRFSIPWAPPGPRMKDYIACLRAIWRTWQYGDAATYEGEYYRFLRMNPASNPGPIDHPDIPIVVSAVNPYMARLAGEEGGIVTHSFTTDRYMREVLLPNVLAGAAKRGRKPSELSIRAGGFIATGKTEEDVHRMREWVRSRVAYYGSTRSYHGVLALDGWGEEGAALHRLSMENRWQEMTDLVTDEILDEFCVAGTWEQLPKVLETRYAGIATDLSFSANLENAADAEQIADVVRQIKLIRPFGVDD